MPSCRSTLLTPNVDKDRLKRLSWPPGVAAKQGALVSGDAGPSHGARDVARPAGSRPETTELAGGSGVGAEASRQAGCARHSRTAIPGSAESKR